MYPRGCRPWGIPYPRGGGGDIHGRSTMGVSTGSETLESLSKGSVPNVPNVIFGRSALISWCGTRLPS
eukprot:1457252-Pyramimonas_sp.AAC.1